MKLFYNTFIILLVFKGHFCQECRMPSESCSDDKSCCGGCCENFVCIDTYHDCRVKDDPCSNKECPEDAVCQIFTPEDCHGCDQQVICVNYNSPSTSEKTTTTKGKSSSRMQVEYNSAVGLTVLSLFFIKLL